MLSGVKLPPSRTYRSGSENDPFKFYLDCLFNSNRFDLLLGYFSSAAISILALGFAKFIHSGGKLRIVANHVLSEKDKNSILLARETDLEPPLDLTDIKALHATLDDYGKHFFRCLSYLIASKKIEIKIVRPKTKGITHYKSGLFYDDQNKVSFNASCNFTAYGLLENAESLSCFLSTDGTSSVFKIQEDESDFERIFNGEVDHLEYLDAEDIEVAVKTEFGVIGIDELLIEERELIEKKRLNTSTHNNLAAYIEELEAAIDKIDKEPRFPYTEGPRKYQNIAFENWKNNNQQGLFAMATGTGKTITSLNCLFEIFKKTGYYKALILVPTTTLVNQWEIECKKFNFSSVIKVFSKTKWQNSFAALLTQERLFPTDRVSYIVITTYASFSRENIFADLNLLSPKTLLIADECHNMGSPNLLKLLPKITYKRRIGLSATPERQFDEEGTQKIYSFFNSKDNYTYEFSMQLAINGDIENEIAPVLCRYYYYPHIVPLTETEMKKYVDLSTKISKFYNSESDSFSSNSILTSLLLARKRIIHKAANKIAVFSTIVKGQYNKNGHLKYTLVYVPEGNDPDDYFETNIFSETEEEINDIEDSRLIDVFTKAIRDIGSRITIKKFISSTTNKEDILDQFTKGEIEVLASMKCLDEGVDVPRSELAIFCASTGNPRQFVQRRGRILRKHPDKAFAYIHDLVVIPEINRNSENYKMERSLLKKELDRVNNFALLSENSSHALNILSDTMNYYNLNLYNND